MSASEFIGNLIAYSIMSVVFVPLVFAMLYYTFIAIAYIIPPLRRRMEGKMQ